MNREFTNKYSLTKAQDISFVKALKNNEENPIYQYYVQEFLPAWDEVNIFKRFLTIIIICLLFLAKRKRKTFLD